MKRARRLLLSSVLFILLLCPPAYGERVYRAQPGDSLYIIAQKYGITLNEIISSNRYLRYPDRLVPGQLLIIPEKEVQWETYEQRQVPSSESQGDGDNFAGSAPEDNNGVGVYNNQIRNLAELYKEYKNIVFFCGSSHGNKIALTFDDGPGDVTCNQALDLLKEFNIPATFFLVGEQVYKYPHVATRIVKEGHTVGLHSWSHVKLDQVSLERFKEELFFTEEAIKQITGKRPLMLRPPYGILNREELEYLQQHGYNVVNWSVDSLDWKYPDHGDQVIINTLRDVRGGSIILFHTLPGVQPSKIIGQVLPEIIYTLQSQGYEFVTVNELLSIPAYKEKQPINPFRNPVLIN
ncbi:MAG: polysaccharide deacetylase family protein [Clostridia bacterium]|nr:polysaccharide deacetylase family protein [Clostridia bacterium]